MHQLVKGNFVFAYIFHLSAVWEHKEVLTHWGQVTHICVGNLTIIGSDNGLSPGRRQAITWTNVGILLIGPLGTNFSEMLIEIHTFSFKKMHLKMSSGNWRPFCLGLNVLTKICESVWDNVAGIVRLLKSLNDCSAFLNVFEVLILMIMLIILILWKYVVGFSTHPIVVYWHELCQYIQSWCLW